MLLNGVSKQMGVRENRSRVLAGVYESSWGISVITLAIIAALEIFMLVYTVINTDLYGCYEWRYRGFYISLLSVAIIFIALYLYVKNDIEHRCKLLNVANPLGAIFLFAWSLAVTYSDYTLTGVIDPTVLMTFSLMIPLGFYVLPGMFLVIALIADAVMLYFIMMATGSIGQVINVSIFFVFQIVLGLSFLRLKMNLAERIVEERINAVTDVLTGLANRRAYEAALDDFAQRPPKGDFAYVAIDINGLKEINDGHGHEMGDALIIGTAQCIAQSFGSEAKAFRIGGDEFAVLLPVGQGECDEYLSAFERSMKSWSGEDGLSLSASCGCACSSEFSGCSIADLAREADKRMYESKVRYYQQGGADRRRRD